MICMCVKITILLLIASGFLLWNVGCRKSIPLDYGSHGTKPLSEAVVLHRTSAKDVIVTDSAGFGIVPGNVMNISMASDKSVIVEYLPFDTKSSTPSSEFVSIDLATGNVQSMTSKEANEGTGFVSIAKVLPP